LRKSLIAAVVAAVAIGGLTIPSAASPGDSSLPGSKFEIEADANITVDTPLSGVDDWVEVPSARIKADQPTGSADDSFGNGTKEDTIVPSVIDGSIPPNKSDLKEFGTYQEGNTTDGFFHLFWSRVQDPSGTTNMDFELNQSSVLSDNGVTPVRTNDDLLITYDLSRGGTRATISLREWVGDATSGAWGPVTSFADSKLAIGTINTTAIELENGLGPYSPRTFGEASVDMGLLFDTTTGCQTFGSAYLKSRSSDSFTAAVKDFIAPVAIDLTNCGQVKIVKKDDAGNVLAGAKFTLYSGDTALDLFCTTDALGLCTISNVPFGTYTVKETVTPAGYETAADQTATVSAQVQTVTLTFVDNRSRGKVSILKTDDDNPAVKLAGAQFTLYVDAAPVGGSPGAEDVVADEAGIVGNPCTTNVEGVCEITNILYGNYWVKETVTPANHDTAAPQQAQIGVGNENVQLTFVNVRHRGAIKVAKTYGTNTPQSGVSFTVNGVTKTTDADGYACFDNLLFGSYDVTETVPGGFIAEGATTKSVTVDNKASCADATYVGETVAFKNIPLSKIEVSFAPLVTGTTDATIQCVKGADTLAPSATDDRTGWARNKRYTDLTPGTYTCTVVIS
jgi:uncharacterized surface anchored protein